jgi:hypothetical protein
MWYKKYTGCKARRLLLVHYNFICGVPNWRSWRKEDEELADIIPHIDHSVYHYNQKTA